MASLTGLLFGTTTSDTIINIHNRHNSLGCPSPYKRSKHLSKEVTCRGQTERQILRKRNIVATLGARGTARCFRLWICHVGKIESERKKPKCCQNCGSISIWWYPDSSQILWTKILCQTSPTRLVNLRIWIWMTGHTCLPNELKSITKRNIFPRTTVKGLQQYRGKSTSKIHRLVNNSLIALLTNSGVANGKSEAHRDAETGVLKSEPETKKCNDLIEKQICDRQTQNLRLRDSLHAFFFIRTSNFRLRLGCS